MSEAVLTQPKSADAAKPLRPALKRRSLAAKLAIALVGLITLVLLINGVANLWLNYDDAKRAILGVQLEKAQAAAERVDGFISDVENQIGWTTRAEWRRVPVEQQRYDLIRLLRQAPAVTEVSYLDPAGKEQLRVSRLEPDQIGSGKDFSNEERFKQAVANKAWFGPVYFQRGSEPYITVAIAHAGRNPGVTVAEVNLKLVYDVVTAIKVGATGYAFVVTSEGRLIAHPDLSLVLRNTDLSQVPQVARALPSKVSASGPADRKPVTSEMVTDASGLSVLSAHAPIGRVGWIVFVQSPVSEALAPVYRSLIQTAALLGLGLLLAAVAGTFLSRRMVVPIRRLQEGAERLGGGDLSQRIAISTGDEIETLADRFNQMAGRIQESYETLESKVEERTSDLNESLEQQTATADVLKAISRSAFDLDTVLTTLISTAVRLSNSAGGQIFRREGDIYRHAADRMDVDPAFREYERQSEIKAGRGTLVGRVALDKRAVQIADAWNDPEYDDKDAARLGNVRAMLGVPLMRGTEPIGAFALGRKEPIPFTQRQIELVTTFADQAVIAIENVRLLNETKEALERQTATADILKVIASSPDDVQPVFDAIAERSNQLVHGLSTTVFMLTDGVLNLVAFTATNPSADATLKARFPTPLAMWSWSGEILRGEVSYIVDTELTDDGLRDLARLRGYRSMVFVPLLRDGELIGVIGQTKVAAGAFPENYVQLLKTFADQAVIAISNVRLFQEVQARTKELSLSLDELRTAQDRLVQTEKLASLGQLTAGIAHEIKNPLNFVNNFSALSAELIDELNDVLKPAALDGKMREEIDELTEMLKGNLEKVVQHGKRADSIVKNMLLHSREGSGEHRLADINAIVEESLNLAYHGARAEKPNFNITLERNLDAEAGMADLYPQEITRVFLNLMSNGFYATTKRKEAGEDGFEPVLKVSTRDLGNKVEVRIRDNGTGIPAEVREKMFNPFFTTKPAGEGTGLGLSMSHDIIVKQHHGTIDVMTEPNQFTEFVITLPRSSAAKSISGGKP